MASKNFVEVAVFFGVRGKYDSGKVERAVIDSLNEHEQCAETVATLYAHGATVCPSFNSHFGLGERSKDYLKPRGLRA